MPIGKFIILSSSMSIVPKNLVSEEVMKYLSEVESNQKIIGLCIKKDNQQIGKRRNGRRTTKWSIQKRDCLWSLP